VKEWTPENVVIGLLVVLYVASILFGRNKS
jgi:hypothetical protein